MPYIEKIIDAETGDEIVRPYTDEEIEAAKKAEAEAKKLTTLLEKQAVARLEILEKLGITEDEAKLLLS